jgi:hypothetical protein
MIRILTKSGATCLFLALSTNFACAQTCSDNDYATFKRYDAYLDSNPNMADDLARSNFAARVGMRPAALKDLYFRCLFRWKDSEPAASRKVGEDAMAQMTTGGESPLTRGHTCETLGFRYGHTAASTLLGKRPKVGWDFVMPQRCKNNASTEAGIKAGTRAAAQ